MDYSWLLFFTLAVATFGVLKGLTFTVFPNLFVDTGLCLLSAIIADTLVKLLVNTVPRKLLPDLGDKAVFVTGCDTGFGNLCARRLDALGVTVFAGCLFPDGPGAAELRASTSSNLHVVALDVTKDDHVKDAVKYVEQSLNGKELWAVINNAGIGILGEIDWCPIELLQQVFDVNTFGVVRVTKGFLPMIRKSKGRIVCVSSIAGRLTTPVLVYYSMSKCAVQAFVHGLRREMRKWSVSVHGIEPTGYSTGITSSKNVAYMLARTWESCPEESRTAYGKEYVDACEERINSLGSIFISGRIHEVVDDMVDAAVGLTPKIRYVPGFLQQVVPRIACLLPAQLSDYLQDVLMQVKRGPAAIMTIKK